MQQFFGINWYDSFARFQTASGVFTSPDPLAEKYYPQSPYAYCAGDPVNLVDPEGMDDWEINNKGKVVSHAVNTYHDAFFIVDNDSSLLLIEGSTGFNSSNQSSAAKLFKFFSDNTSVEFGLITSDDYSFVITNYEEGSINVDMVAEKMNNNGNRIGLIMHSHPHNSPPSGFGGDKRDGGDKIAASLMPFVEHYVYLPRYNAVINYDMFTCYHMTSFDWMFK